MRELFSCVFCATTTATATITEPEEDLYMQGSYMGRYWSSGTGNSTRIIVKLMCEL